MISRREVPGAACRSGSDAVLCRVRASGDGDGCGQSVCACSRLMRSRAKGGAAWISYRVPMAGGPRRMCCFDSSAQANGGCCGRCRLERGDGVVLSAVDPPPPTAARIVIEPPTEMRVFVRVDNRAVVRVRTFSLDCDVDASGVSVTTLDNVAVDESVAWLTRIITAPSDSDVNRNALQMPALSALAPPPWHGRDRSIDRPGPRRSAAAHAQPGAVLAGAARRRPGRSHDPQRHRCRS